MVSTDDECEDLMVNGGVRDSCLQAEARWGSSPYTINEQRLYTIRQHESPILQPGQA